MRVSTLSSFSRVLLGLRSNQAALLRAQQEVASGRRILRPSDDPSGTARALALRRDLAGTERIRAAVAAGRLRLEQASSTLLHGSELLTRGRELLVQAMSGAVNAQDRATIASELEALREQLLDAANLSVDGNYVFGGTRVGARPWEEVATNGTTFVVYRGNGEVHTVPTGADSTVAITAAGDQVFGRATPGPTRIDGLTGAASGTTADEGSGMGYLVFRHDGTDSGLLGSVGVALIDGGDEDTLLGPNTLRIDSTAGTLQLEGGALVTIPPPGSRANVTVRNEHGGELHLDLEGWNGNDYTGTIQGRGSVSLDGTSFIALTFTETDLELRNDAMGQVLHLDARGVRRAGTELVTFGDTANPFDVLQGIVDDLRNEQELDATELATRLGSRLGTLERIHDDVLVGLGALGARTARLSSAESRQEDLGVQLLGRLSTVEDADLAEAALDLSHSQLVLQLAQAAGARVLQTSLLNFLR